ncbi:MAG: hypothetical protein KIS91_07500 [Anaerolineae bacterium]|nr:hypothetical protein [Anaerolineae bacterium]
MPTARVAPPPYRHTLALGFNLAVSAPLAIAIAAVLDVVYWLSPACPWAIPG